MLVIVFLLILLLLLSLVMLMFSECCDKPVTIFLYHCHPLTDMNDFVYINAVYLVISVEFSVS